MVDLCKALGNATQATSLHEVMAVRTAFVFDAVVGQCFLDGVWALTQHAFEKHGTTPAAFVRVDTRIQLSGVVVYGHKQVLPFVTKVFTLTFEPRQALGIQMQSFTR